MFSQVNPKGLVGIALLAMAFLPSHAWAEGFYADVHGGVPFFNNDSARVTALTTGGSVRAHTNYETGWLAGSSAGYEWAAGFASEFEFTFVRTTLIESRPQLRFS
jgi:hypothetical protein